MTSPARYAIRGIGVLLPGYLRENRTAPHIIVNRLMLEGVPLARWLALAERYPVRQRWISTATALVVYNLTFRGQFSRFSTRRGDDVAWAEPSGRAGRRTDSAGVAAGRRGKTLPCSWAATFWRIRLRTGQWPREVIARTG